MPALLKTTLTPEESVTLGRLRMPIVSMVALEIAPTWCCQVRIAGTLPALPILSKFLLLAYRQTQVSPRPV